MNEVNQKRGRAAKRKGARRELQARDMLIADGWAVTKAGGSLGLWDLVAVRRLFGEPYLPQVKLIQVKSNRPPLPSERANLSHDIRKFNRLFVRGEVWRFNDGTKAPEIKEVE